MQENDVDKLWSLEAEAAVLGSMIIDRDCIGRVLPILPTEDAFFKDEHRIIYATLLLLYTENKPTDAIALRTELKNANQLGKVGGVEYIGKILGSVPSSANAVYYAGIIRDRQRYRDLISNVERMGKILDGSGTVSEQTQKIQDIALAMESGKPETAVFTLAAEAVKVADAMPEHAETIPTGFCNIDKIIQGVCPSEFIILAGRPSMGKSALALDFALNMVEAGKSIVFFSLEMTYRGLIERALCNRAKLNMAEIKFGSISERLEKLHNQAEEMQKLDLILHEGAITPEQQIAFVRTRQKTGKVDVVFVDYLQLMSAGRRAENRQQEITTISRKLKLAAVQEQVPIIALSQLNRQVESRQTHRPRLSDLRESGSLEQDADIVMLLHREDYYRRNENPEAIGDGTAEIIVAKNRRGATGIAKLIFLDEYVRFGDAAMSHVGNEI